MKIVVSLIVIALLAGIALIVWGAVQSNGGKADLAATPTAEVVGTPQLPRQEVISEINRIICPGRRLSQAEAFGVTATYLGGHLWNVREIDGLRAWTFDEATNTLRASNTVTSEFQAKLKASPGCFGQRPAVTPGSESGQ
jgi:hypothetical protein